MVETRTLHTGVERQLTYMPIEVAVKTTSIEVTGDITAQFGAATYSFSRLALIDPKPMDLMMRGRIAEVSPTRYRIEKGFVDITGHRSSEAEGQLSFVEKPYVDPAKIIGVDQQGREISLEQIAGTVTLYVNSGSLGYSTG